MKTLKNIVLVTLPTLVLLFIILELFFRFVIPASNPPLSVYRQDEQFINYSNERAEGLYTVGKFASIRTRWTINNDGWNYPVDYTADHGGVPLIAVIGDSYVDTDIVSSDENFPYRLRERIYPEMEVYAFGLSGLPLSQYFHLNRYANNNFDPDIVIVNLIYNDFEESFRKFNPGSECWQLVEKDSTFSIEPPRQVNISPTTKTWKKLLYKSAFFRYLHRNLLVFQMFKKVERDEVESNVEIVEDMGKRAEIRRGTDFLFGKIKEVNEGRRLIFVMDAPRPSIYSGRLEESRVIWMNEMVGELAEKHGCELIDLTEAMKKDWAENKKEFNPEIDGHWNVYGHQLVADVVYEYLSNHQ